MPLEIRKGSKWWYGRVMANGRNICKNLGVEIRGAIPPSLKQLGEPAFERSRMKAQMVLEQLQLQLKKRTTSEELVQAIHEIRTGERVQSLSLAAMPEAWKAASRPRPASARYLDQGVSTLERFIVFLDKHHPVAREMADVQTRMARNFLKSEADRGISPKTYNSTLILLRSCFHSLRKEAGLVQNPFEGLQTQAEQIVFRKPFTEAELGAIVDAGKDDDFIHPIIVTGICTAMRKGDCCLLNWEAVDLVNRFITVKTSKTGDMVSIPLFPMLRDILTKMGARKTGHIFSAQAEMYKDNPDGITYRVRQVFRKAGFFDEEEPSESMPHRGPVHQDRPRGVRRASVRDFHSFRVTWVTLALSAGVPLELVKKVTGHRTAHVVMKHYFQPGREEFRRTLAAKLPALLGGTAEQKPIEPEALKAKLQSMTAETWVTVRDNLLEGLGLAQVIGPRPSDAKAIDF